VRFELDNKRSKRQIDMTPMIDCVFQLLLFFLVASHFDEQARVTGEGSLDGNLPAAASAMPMVMQPREMIVNIDDSGAFWVGGQTLEESQLAERLRRAQIDNPGSQSVVIRGDERADWKFVARVMSLCNAAQISDYRVAVVPEAESDGPGTGTGAVGTAPNGGGS
jgi:biopolymer transport protein ExbD